MQTCMSISSEFWEENHRRKFEKPLVLSGCALANFAPNKHNLGIGISFTAMSLGWALALGLFLARCIFFTWAAKAKTHDGQVERQVLSTTHMWGLGVNTDQNHGYSWGMCLACCLGEETRCLWEYLPHEWEQKSSSIPKSGLMGSLHDIATLAQSYTDPETMRRVMPRPKNNEEGYVGDCDNRQHCREYLGDSARECLGDSAKPNTSILPHSMLGWLGESALNMMMFTCIMHECRSVIGQCV